MADLRLVAPIPPRQPGASWADEAVRLRLIQEGIHAVVLEGDRWACQACPFVGELPEAVRHAVAHQWDLT